MNIIYGQAQAQQIGSNYLVLELDTITIKSSEPIQVYCVVENTPLDELAQVDNQKKLHSELMHHYRQRNWDFVFLAAKDLMGCWGSELDTFYQEMIARVTQFKEQEPDESWTGIVAK
jgi:hypothetical protein